ncbi:2087_t:CDS:2, partial [Funneliformis mosseae]
CNLAVYVAFWRNNDTPSIKKFLDYRRNMGDLADPETEHQKGCDVSTDYSQSSNCLFAQTPCELLPCKTKVAYLFVEDKRSNSVKLFWNLQEIILESEIVDEKSKLQWNSLKETSSAVQEKQVSSYKRNASKIDEETVSIQPALKRKLNEGEMTVDTSNNPFDVSRHEKDSKNATNQNEEDEITEYKYSQEMLNEKVELPNHKKAKKEVKNTSRTKSQKSRNKSEDSSSELPSSD